MRIVGYRLMPNHWRLVLWSEGDGDLSRLIQAGTSIEYVVDAYEEGKELAEQAGRGLKAGANRLRTAGPDPSAATR
jgi:hypothetical protein